MQGMDQLQLMLQDHTVLLNGIVQYCQALQQGQSAMMQNQGILIHGQRVVLQEILTLHTTADNVLMVMCFLSVLTYFTCYVWSNDKGNKIPLFV